MNFPSRHPLNHSFRRNVVVGQADVILAIEINDHWAALNAFHDRIVRTSQPLYKPTHEDHHARPARHVSEGQFPGFRPLRRHRSCGCGRRRGLAAGAYRSRAPAHRRRPQIRFRGARQALCGGAARHAGAGQIRCHGRLGCEPDHHRRGCVPRFRRRSRTTTGRWSATPSPMPGRTAYGNSTSRISGSASRAAPVSAIMPRLRSAPRSPISAMAV